jgi:glucokinase-like ROK family protein
LADSVLRLIWRERRISRAEIARRTGLSRSTVTEIVRDLLRTELVAEVGTGRSRGGRRPIVLEFQDDARVILGVDIGATHVAVALTDLRGRVLAWNEATHPVRMDPEGTRALTIRLCDASIPVGKSETQQLIGIGVGVPSPVDPDDPYGLSDLVLPEWEGRSGLESLQAHYRLPVLVDNDANLGALAERWWGAGREVDDFAYVKLATGIGLGHILGGEIYRGAAGFAGEIGHLAIDPHGEPCICGLRGCLATFVGSRALVARAGALLADHPESLLAGRDVTIAAIEDAAIAGDRLALRVVNEAAEHLGVAVAGLLNLNNPSMVILGGGLVRVGELLLEPLREAIRSRTLVSSVAAAEIRTSELGPQAAAVGAATLVLDAALNDPRIFQHRRGQEVT